MLWVINLTCQVATHAKTFINVEKSMPPPLRDAMMRVVYVHFAAGCIYIGASALGLIFLLLAFVKRRRHFSNSIALVRKAYLLDCMTPIVFYLCFPFGFFLRTQIIHQEVCTFTLWNLMRMGPVVRQAFAGAAAMDGDVRLASIAALPPPKNYTEISTWEGEGWCISKPDWLVKLFGPAPSMPKLGFTPINIGLIPNVVNFLEGMTGARCQTPGLDRPGSKYSSYALEQEADDEDEDSASKARVQAKIQEYLDAYRQQGLKDMGHGQQARSDLFHVPHVGVEIKEKYRSSAACGNTTTAQCHSVGGALLAQASDKEAFGILMAQTVVCQFASAMSAMADGARVASLLLINVAGMWVMGQSIKRTFPTSFTVLKGFRRATINVKSVLPMDALPGYMLVIAACMFSPSLIITLCTFGQVLGNILFSLGMAMMMAGVGQDLRLGMLMTHHTSYEKTMQLINPVLKRQKMYFGLSGALVVGAMVSFIFKAQKIKLTKIFDLSRMLSPDNIVSFVVSFMFGRSFSRLVFTDFIFGALFDIHDDDMKVKTGEQEIDGLTLLKEWYILTEDSKALKKLETPEYKPVSKKKKKKGDHGEGDSSPDEASDDSHFYGEEEYEDMPSGVPPPPPGRR